jgi:hypothetical protein
VANADGSDVEAVTSPAAVIPEEHPRFSPDGMKIAFSGSLPESVSEEYNQRIYTINADGSGLTELTQPEPLRAETIHADALQSLKRPRNQTKHIRRSHWLPEESHPTAKAEESTRSLPAQARQQAGKLRKSRT